MPGKNGSKPEIDPAIVLQSIQLLLMQWHAAGYTYGITVRPIRGVSHTSITLVGVEEKDGVLVVSQAPASQ
jgi:hypothetical protein